VVGGDRGSSRQSCDDESGDHPALRVDPEKKSVRARERNEAKRAAWREQTRGIDPDRFVWIDETGSHLGMTRRHSRAPRGQRAYGTAPSSRGKNRTLITSLTLEGFGPGLLLDEAIDYATFDGYIIHRLAPTLKPDQLVVADNLTVHYSDRAREAIEARGAHLWHLPPYSPDLNPIEEAFSKVKAFLRTAEPRTLDAHSTAIWAALRTITPQDAAGWFAHAGYGTRRRRPKKRSVSRHQAHNLHFRLPDASPIVMLHVAAPQLFDHLWCKPLYVPN
jgi:transposase